MKIVMDVLLPVVVIAINIVLGAQTGNALFYAAAAVIAVLLVLRLRHALRQRPPD